MKKLLLLLAVCFSLFACEKADINEEASEIETLYSPVYSVDREKIERPGDQSD